MKDPELCQAAYALLLEIFLTYSIQIDEPMMQLIEGWLRAYRLERARIASELPRV